jgi:hypothetical protein
MTTEQQSAQIADLFQTIDYYIEQNRLLEKERDMLALQVECMSKTRFECGDCGDNLGSQCEMCPNGICYECVKKGAPLTEWLIVDRECKKCKKMLCKDCVRVCYDCVNFGERFTVLCLNCSDYKHPPCGGEDWFTCGKHGSITHDHCSKCTSS